MVNERDQKQNVKQTLPPQDPYGQPFYPLTLPLTVGLGSIAVAITLGATRVQRHGLHFLDVVAALVGAALIALSIFLSYALSDRLPRILGPTGMTVFMRLCAFFLVCLGVRIG